MTSREMQLEEAKWTAPDGIERWLNEHPSVVTLNASDHIRLHGMGVVWTERV